MKMSNSMISMTLAVLALMALNTAQAGEVQIVATDFQSRGNALWSVSTTLKHGDTGWEHYADNWRVVDGEGNVLGERVLAHPHVNEQPFSRSLYSVTIPQGVTTVYIEAHDTVHGWSQNRLSVDLHKAEGGKLRVEFE